MLRFIHISDTHVGTDPSFRLYERNTIDALKQLIHYINERLPFKPDFILHTGDVTNSYDDAAMQLAAQTLSELQYPVYYVVGNHDRRGAMREHLLLQPRSEDRLFYDFRLNDYHFIVLDTIGSPDPQGYVSQEQLEWLAERLSNSDARSISLCIHHLALETGVPWYDRNMRIMNDEAFFKVLAPYKDRLRGVFFGHIHRAFTGFREGILCSAAASAFRQIYMYPGATKPDFDFESPGGFAIVMLTHQQTIIRHYTIPNNEM